MRPEDKKEYKKPELQVIEIAAQEILGSLPGGEEETPCS